MLSELTTQLCTVYFGDLKLLAKSHQRPPRRIKTEIIHLRGRDSDLDAAGEV